MPTEKIVWDGSFSVGIIEIDKQHQMLIEMINELIDAQDASVRSETVSDTLTSMTNYAMYHFRVEEDLMRSHEYPPFDAHHLEHMGFIRKTAELASAAVERDQTVPAELLSYLKNWLVGHILNSDMQYKDFFNERGVF